MSWVQVPSLAPNPYNDRQPVMRTILLLAAFLAAPTPPKTVVVAAAANLRPALDELVPAFESAAGLRVVVSYGASGILERQIENGAPFDVFLSADRERVARLGRRGLVREGSRRVYAVGRLALVSSRGAAKIARVADLGRARFRRLAIANPDTAPYGSASRETLRTLGVWDRLRGRIVYAENVRDALRYAETGDADYAFAALSEAEGSGLALLRVPERLHAPLEQEACSLSSSGSPAAAARFLEFLAGPAARAAFERHGYGVP
jgi:molybdate transport system substrate-binding protein